MSSGTVDEVLRRDARRIFLAAVHAADPAPLVHAALLNAPELHAGAPVAILAVGKAAPAMAAAALETLAGHVEACLVVAPAAALAHTPFDRTIVRVIAAGHPLPDDGSARAAGAAIELAGGVASNCVLIVLLSGGASSLMAMPATGITLDEYRNVISMLQRAGADIHELNCVRRHIDSIKGGRMARLGGAGRVLVLLVSDVVGNDLHVIGSGPFAQDPSSSADALDVLNRYFHRDSVPAAIIRRLERGATEPERPARDNSVPARVRHQIIADNRIATDAAAAFARRIGYDVARLDEPVTGEARDAGTRLAELLLPDPPIRRSTCIIAGGETTVTVSGDGAGGRNQELALAAAIHLDGAPDRVLLSGGTDGIDGPTDAAGAVVDGGSVMRMRDAGRDPVDALSRNDCHTVLAAADDLVVTGQTGTNVMDVHVLLRRATDAAEP